MAHQVGEIALLAGITVRTLHHYDRIGLLTPGQRSSSGYRLYDEDDVARLQQILFYRALGMSLDEIAHLMSDPSFDRIDALQGQKAQLRARGEHIRKMIDAIDAAIAAESGGLTMDTGDRLGVFGDFDPAAYEEETAQRWGHTDAHKESARRTSQYTKADWERLGAEGDAINRAFLDLMATGVSPEDAAATDVAERHRAHITRWFYECTPDIHTGLGEMYVEDARFTENIDQAGSGLAAYMSHAILANGLRQVD